MGNNKLTRREFMILSSAGVAGGLFLPWGSVASARRRGHGGMGRGNGNLIDPPAGDIFTDPVELENMSITPGVFEGVVEATVAPVNVNGSIADLLTYNGVFPGPTIRIKQGDRLRIRFRNSLPHSNSSNVLGFPENITNLHTHGLHVSPSGNADNIFLHFEPGEEFLYEYDTSLHEPGNLNWYHPHNHGLVAEQLWGGLAGALVVEDEVNVLSDYETHILVLKDITLSGLEPEPHSLPDFQRGKEGDTVMVNGQVNPVLPIRPGQVQRLRIVNASTARYYKLSLEHHTLYLVGTDSNLLDRPYPVKEILMAPGERIDVLVQANQNSGTHRLLSLPYNRGGNTQQAVTLMTISYEDSPVNESVPLVINPDARRLDLNTGVLPRKRFVLQMMMGRGLIIGHDFERNPYIATSEVGTYEIWEVVNMSPMDHPFHQHVNAAQILEISGGDTTYASLYSSIPGFKDTINVPRMGGRVTMLVPITDFTGSTVFHCHIVEHEDIGMMGIWEIL